MFDILLENCELEHFPGSQKFSGLAAFLWRRGRLHAQAHVGGFIDVEEFAVWYSSFCFAEEAWGRTDRESEKVCLCVCAQHLNRCKTCTLSMLISMFFLIISPARA